MPLHPHRLPHTSSPTLPRPHPPVGLAQRLLAVHHAGTGLVPQLLDQASGGLEGGLDLLLLLLLLQQMHDKEQRGSSAGWAAQAGRQGECCADSLPLLLLITGAWIMLVPCTAAPALLSGIALAQSKHALQLTHCASPPSLPSNPTIWKSRPTNARSPLPHQHLLLLGSLLVPHPPIQPSSSRHPAVPLSPPFPPSSPANPPPSSPPSWGPPPSSWPVSAGRPQRQSHCCKTKSHRSSSRHKGVRQGDVQRSTSQASGIRK